MKKAIFFLLCFPSLTYGSGIFNPGSGSSGGGGAVSLSSGVFGVLPSTGLGAGSTNYIQNTDLLQGATAFVSTGTIKNFTATNIRAKNEFLTDSTIGTNLTLMETGGGLSGLNLSGNQICSGGSPFSGGNLNLSNSGDCGTDSNNILIANNGTSPANRGIGVNLTGNGAIQNTGIGVDVSGTNTTNIGMNLSATQGTNNYALNVRNGQVNILSSATVSGAQGLEVTYAVDAGSYTGAGLGVCGDSTHALGYTSTSTYKCQVFGGGDMILASTQTVSGQKVFTSTRAIVVQPTGDLGITIGLNAYGTAAASMYDMSTSTSLGLVLFNNAAQTVGSANSMLTIISTNPAYGGYFMRVIRTDSGSNGEFRTDSPAPNNEFVETDFSPAAQGKFELGINAGVSYWATRNANDTSFERTVEFPNKGATGGGITIKSTGTLRLEDSAGSSIGFKAPDTLGATWSHDLWKTTNNLGLLLIQTSNGGTRPLAWSNTVGVAASSVTFSSSVVVSGFLHTTEVNIIAPVTNEFSLSISTSAAAPYQLRISTSGHFITNGTAPAITSCGTTPNGSVVGDDNEGIITIGGGVVTSCVMTFAFSWGGTPSCNVTDNSTSVNPSITSQSSTSITVGLSATLGGGLVNYRCGCSGPLCR